MLETKYGSRNKNPESYTAGGKPCNTFALSKDDNGNVRSVLTPLRYRMLFFNLFSQKPYFTFQEATAIMISCKQYLQLQTIYELNYPFILNPENVSNSAVEYINARFSPPE